MFKVRVIPCLDVKDGRVVKGVNFVDLRDAGDPVERRRLRRGGRRRIELPRYHRQPRESRHHAHVVRRTPGVLHAAHRRRWGAALADIRAGSPPEPTRGDQHCGGRRAPLKPRKNSATSASSWRSAPGGIREGEAGRWEIFTFGGRQPTGSMRSLMRARWSRSAPERFSAFDGSRWHPEGVRRRAHATDAESVSVPVIASGGVGELDHLIAGFGTDMPRRCLASIFHFGERSVRDAKGYMAHAGLPMWLDT